MSKEGEECQQTVCLDGDASGGYKKFANKRFQNMTKLYQDNLTGDSDQTSGSTSKPQNGAGNTAKGDAFYASCPNSKEALGFFTWNYLHTMSVYYPEQPTLEQQSKMSTFMHTFAEFYPCKSSQPPSNLSLCRPLQSRHHREPSQDCQQTRVRCLDMPETQRGEQVVVEARVRLFV